MPKTVLFCGSRDWRHEASIRAEVERLPPGSRIIHGDARGADRIAAAVGMRLGHVVIPYPADWERHGGAAGPIRNSRMLAEEDVDLVVAFPKGKSRGTWDMVAKARRAGIPVRVVGPQPGG